MGKKSTKKTTNEEVVVVQTEEVTTTPPIPPIPTPIVEEPKKKKRASSKKNTEVTIETETVSVPETVVVETTELENVKVEVEEEVQPTTAPTKKKRRVIKKEDLAKDLESLTKDLTENISNKDLLKRIKSFRSDIIKILKLKTDKKERDISNSGFMKPVNVSEKMRFFLKLQPDELTRRLDITKRLCEYIKNNDLQDPSDRRNIVPDECLRTLLNIQENDPNLTYYSIQQKLKDHIIKI